MESLHLFQASPITIGERQAVIKENISSTRDILMLSVFYAYYQDFPSVIGARTQLMHKNLQHHNNLCTRYLFLNNNLLFTNNDR